MYGLLRPLDLMQPYRLEMCTKMAVNGYDRLYDFWDDGLREALYNELDDDELVVNLDTKEVFKALWYAKLRVDVIKPEYKDFKYGDLDVIGFSAKNSHRT